MSDAFSPTRAIAARSIAIVRYCWPVIRSTRKSPTPRTPAAMRAISSAFAFSVARSSPKIFTAMSARTPVTISSTRSEIGCAITSCTPGMTFSFSRIASAMSSWVQPSGHSPRGLRLTIGSASFGPAGSAGLSPRPIRDTTVLTPGTSSTSRIASISSAIDSSSEMLGTRSIAGEIEPSFISGMNAVPRNGNTASVARKSATAAPIAFPSFASAQSRMRRYGPLIVRISQVSCSAPPLSR